MLFKRLLYSQFNKQMRGTGNDFPLSPLTESRKLWESVARNGRALTCELLLWKTHHSVRNGKAFTSRKRNAWCIVSSSESRYPPLKGHVFWQIQCSGDRREVGQPANKVVTRKLKPSSLRYEYIRRWRLFFMPADCAQDVNPIVSTLHNVFCSQKKYIFRKEPP